MQVFLIDTLQLFIPVIALLIALVGATGSLIVKPLVQALARLTEAQPKLHGGASDPSVLDLEQRIISLERTLERVLEEQEFERELQSGRAPATPHFAADQEEARSLSRG